MVIKRTTKTTTKKQSESESMKPTKNPVETQAEKVSKEIPTLVVEKLTLEGEIVAIKVVSKKVKKLEFRRRGVMIREVSTHGSTTAKKRLALDVMKILN